MQTLQDCLLDYRRTLRRLLYEKGVVSNPGVTDEWILQQVSELVRMGRPGPVVNMLRNGQLEHLQLMLTDRMVRITYSYPGIGALETLCNSVEYDFAIDSFGVKTRAGTHWFTPETIAEGMAEGQLPAHAGGRIKFEVI